MMTYGKELSQADSTCATSDGPLPLDREVSRPWTERAARDSHGGGGGAVVRDGADGGGASDQQEREDEAAEGNGGTDERRGPQGCSVLSIKA